MPSHHREQVQIEECCVTCEGAHSYRNCPDTDGNIYRDNIQEFVSQASAVNYNQGNTNYRPPMMSDQIRPLGFPPVPNNQNVQLNQRNNQNCFILNQNQENHFNQGPVYQPLVFQPPAYQAPAYQALAPQTQSVSKEDFSVYVKANDMVMRNMKTQGMAECLALANLGASINLMLFSVCKRLSLPDLTPTCMTLELADRLISHSVGVAEDVYVKRSFLKTGRALIDVFEGELTLCVGKEAITFNLDQTSRCSTNYSDTTAKRINVIDMAYEEYSQEVLGFFDIISSGNHTPYYDPIVSTTSPTLTLFGNSDFLL
nr:reverse transcriptase domain-containing protein [Tanacetum cinerariifolium]